MSAGKELSHCRVQALAIALYGMDGHGNCSVHIDELIGLLVAQREYARQPLIADLKELRAKHKALREQLRQVVVLCAVPDGYGIADASSPEPHGTFVLVSSIRKILGGEHG